jgi:3-hydroxybutyryl-CoA dehydrogenase
MLGGDRLRWWSPSMGIGHFERAAPERTSPVAQPAQSDITRIAVIGAGLMGHGIALELAAHGYDVRLHDSDTEQLARAEQRVAGSLQLLRDSGNLTAEQVTTAQARLRRVGDLAEAVADVDLVIEAVVEILAIKQAVFRALDELAPATAIFASNTSSYMPSSLAEATTRPEQVVVTHYFNPPHLLPLVEIVPSPATSPATIAAMKQLYESINKSPVILRDEILGFVGNRLQTALLREALALVEEGIATPADIDTIIRTGFGRRLALAGIFEVRDLSGWDVSITVHEELAPAISAATDVPPVLHEIAAAARGDDPAKVQRRAEIMRSLAAIKRVLDG